MFTPESSASEGMTKFVSIYLIIVRNPKPILFNIVTIQSGKSGTMSTKLIKFIGCADQVPFTNY